MARYVGGTRVEGGYYWSAGTWQVQVVADGGGVLPGDAASRYVKVPFPALLVVVPVVGGLFLVTLPFIGFALVAWALVKRVLGGAKGTAADLATTMTPGWTPGEAHLTGKPGEEGSRPAGEAPALDELEREIAERKER